LCDVDELEDLAIAVARTFHATGTLDIHPNPVVESKAALSSAWRAWLVLRMWPGGFQPATGGRVGWRPGCIWLSRRARSRSGGQCWGSRSPFVSPPCGIKRAAFGKAASGVVTGDDLRVDAVCRWGIIVGGASLLRLGECESCGDGAIKRGLSRFGHQGRTANPRRRLNRRHGFAVLVGCLDEIAA
jgi:hypothetical protein